MLVASFEIYLINKEIPVFFDLVLLKWCRGTACFTAIEFALQELVFWGGHQFPNIGEACANICI